jgi:hypothetical protein
VPELLFRLRNVPDDEADEIRELLTTHGIDWYETPAGKWGISLPAIWLRDSGELQRAGELLYGYQQQRSQRMRDELDQARRERRVETVFDRIRQQPLRFLLYVIGILAVLYLTIKPFVSL